jgi:hypothetical protein
VIRVRAARQGGDSTVSGEVDCKAGCDQVDGRDKPYVIWSPVAGC